MIPAEGGAGDSSTGLGGNGGVYIEDEYWTDFQPLDRNYEYKFRISGGGGGGGSYAVSGLDRANCRGGGGAPSTSEIDGHITSQTSGYPQYGAGGAGGGGIRDYDEVRFTDGSGQLYGPRPYSGQSGGSGYCYIVVSNGIISG
jgi:hypothetical protein